MIKVIIANDNDILYKNLSTIALQYKGKIETIKVPLDKLNSFICQIKAKNLIVFDTISPVTFGSNVLKNALNRIDKENIIILVVDFNNLTNTINQKKNKFFHNKKQTNLSLFDTIISIIVDSLKDTSELEKQIDSILWKLGFNSYFKGTIYIKDCILLAYSNNDLLHDMSKLVLKVSEKNNVFNDKIVRSAMDKCLNHILDYLDNKRLYEIFGDNYDGRKISLKYFIDLCIHHLKNQRYCCFNDKKGTTSLK